MPYMNRFGYCRTALGLSALLLGIILLLGVDHLYLRQPTSAEFKELSNQEEELQLPSPDKSYTSDEGCRWVSGGSDDPGKKQWGCSRSISLTYEGNIRIAGQIRDKLVANGWKEKGYAGYIGATQQADTLSVDQISQGLNPKPASRTSYFFAPKPTAQGNLCVRMYVNARGDNRNPTKPSIDLELYGKSQGC